MTYIISVSCILIQVYIINGGGLKVALPIEGAHDAPQLLGGTNAGIGKHTNVRHSRAPI